MRSLFVGLTALATIAANAQFDGPSPLAWRWLPPSGVATHGAPLVQGDTVYLASGGRIYAVDRATGNKVWQFPAEDPISGKFPDEPILAAGSIVAVGNNGTVYGIDASTGQSKWSFDLPGTALGQPVVCGQMLVQALSENKLVAIDPTNGTAVWTNENHQAAPYNVFDGLTGKIASAGGNLLFLTSTNELHCLNPVTRRENVWQRPVRFQQLSAYAQPIVYGDYIYMASGPYLVAINPGTGVPVWQTDTRMQLSFPPAISAAGIFVVSDDGTAMVFDLQNGHPLKSLKGPIQLNSFPAVAPSAVGSKFVVPTTSGALDLIDPANGSMLWSYVMRPIGGDVKVNSQTTGRTGGPGSGPGGGGAGGQGPGAGGFGGGGAGGQNPGGPGGQNNKEQTISEIEATGPAVLDGQTLLVPAADSSLFAFDKDLGVDLTPPIVQMLFPNPGDQVSNKGLLLAFKVRDEGSGVKDDSVAVTIDGTAYKSTLKRDGTLLVEFSNFGTGNPMLAMGRHDIAVTAVDWLGNTGTTHYALTIDPTLPAVKLPGQEDKTNNRNGPGGGGAPGKGGGGGGDGG